MVIVWLNAVKMTLHTADNLTGPDSPAPFCDSLIPHRTLLGAARIGPLMDALIAHGLAKPSDFIGEGAPELPRAPICMWGRPKL